MVVFMNVIVSMALVIKMAYVNMDALLDGLVRIVKNVVQMEHLGKVVGKFVATVKIINVTLKLVVAMLVVNPVILGIDAKNFVQRAGTVMDVLENVVIVQ